MMACSVRISRFEKEFRISDIWLVSSSEVCMEVSSSERRSFSEVSFCWIIWRRSWVLESIFLNFFRLFSISKGKIGSVK